MVVNLHQGAKPKSCKIFGLENQAGRDRPGRWDWRDWAPAPHVPRPSLLTPVLASLMKRNLLKVHLGLCWCCPLTSVVFPSLALMSPERLWKAVGRVSWLTAGEGKSPACFVSLASFQLEHGCRSACLRWHLTAVLTNVTFLCLLWEVLEDGRASQLARHRPAAGRPRASTPALPTDRHSDCCIPDLALSANASFAFAGWSPQELPSLLHGPSSLLASFSGFVPALSLKTLRAPCLKTVWRACSWSCSAGMVHWSSPVHPDGARAWLDAVTCVVSLSLSAYVTSARSWFHSSYSFIFWRMLVCRFQLSGTQKECLAFMARCWSCAGLEKFQPSVGSQQLSTSPAPLSRLNHRRWRSRWGSIRLLAAAAFGPFLARFPSHRSSSLVAPVPRPWDPFCRAAEAVGEAVPIASHRAMPLNRRLSACPTGWLPEAKCDVALCALLTCASHGCIAKQNTFAGVLVRAEKCSLNLTKYLSFGLFLAQICCHKAKVLLNLLKKVPNRHTFKVLFLKQNCESLWA